jgi:hypothetical protein
MCVIVVARSILAIWIEPGDYARGKGNGEDGDNGFTRRNGATKKNGGKNMSSLFVFVSLFLRVIPLSP